MIPFIGGLGDALLATTPGFSILGPLEGSEGEPFIGSPLGNHGDVGVRLHSGILDIYFNSGFQICHSTLAFDPENVRTGWSESPLSGNSVIPQLAKQVGTPHERGLDTPFPYYHVSRGDHWCYYQAFPGTTPAEEPGGITAIQAASSTDANSVTRTWVKEAGFVVQPTLPGETGFQEIEGEVATNRGGCSEISVLWDPDLGRTVEFHRGLSWPGNPSGPFSWQMFRGVETAALDGLTFDKDPTPVFNPIAETPAGHPAYDTGGAHHFTVQRDTQDGIYHCVYIHGIGTPNFGIYHAYSSSIDKGQAGTWVLTTNPLVRLTDLEPYGLAGDLGGPQLLFDPGSERVWLFFDAAPAARYSNGKVMVAEGTRADLGSGASIYGGQATGSWVSEIATGGTFRTNLATEGKFA